MKALLAGIGIGAMIGIAIAPNSVGERRRDLLRRAGERFSSFREQASAPHPVSERAEPRADEQSSDWKRSTGTQASAASEGDSLMTIINDWPESRLIEIEGIGPGLALKIIQSRPYRTESDLTEAKFLPPSAIDALRKAA